MSISLIGYGVLAIGLLIAAASMFRAFNSGKVAAAKADEEKEDTKQAVVKGETREDILKARMAVHRERRWWQIFRKRDEVPTPVPALPELQPKPNRPLGG